MADRNPKSDAQNIRKFLSIAEQSVKVGETIKGKYGVTPRPGGMKDTEIISSRMVADAEYRIEKGKEGAISVYGNPKNENTCAAGVCTIAADAGVDFSKMTGNINTGLATDPNGRKIPQYNPLIESQIGRAGFVEVGKDDKPQPGDFVQFYQPDEGSDMKQLIPKHLEFVMGEQDGNFVTFNNYGLFNQGKEGGKGYLKRDGAPLDGTNMRTSGTARVYRLDPKVASGIVDKNYKGIREDLSKFDSYISELNSMRKDLMPGESEAVFGKIFMGIKKGDSPQKVKDAVMSIAKNKEYVSSVIDELFAK